MFKNQVGIKCDDVRVAWRCSYGGEERVTFSREAVCFVFRPIWRAVFGTTPQSSSLSFVVGGILRHHAEDGVSSA